MSGRRIVVVEPMLHSGRLGQSDQRPQVLRYPHCMYASALVSFGNLVPARFQGRSAEAKLAMSPIALRVTTLAREAC